MTDLNYISKKQTVSTYCLLVKTTPRPPFDPAVFFFPPLQKKVNFLLSYANDLADQNQMLVQTIEDLQKEADGKTSNLVGSKALLITLTHNSRANGGPTIKRYPQFPAQFAHMN